MRHLIDWTIGSDLAARGPQCRQAKNPRGPSPRVFSRPGCPWYREPLYVSAAGRVDPYRGLQGTGFPNPRTILTLPAGVGENNNIIQAPDGRMLMGISAPCDHCAPASRWSATIASFRPD